MAAGSGLTPHPYPQVTLAELVAYRLQKAGIEKNDPRLIRIREWNQAVMANNRKLSRLRLRRFGLRHTGCDGGGGDNGSSASAVSASSSNTADQFM